MLINVWTSKANKGFLRQQKSNDTFLPFHCPTSLGSCFLLCTSLLSKSSVLIKLFLLPQYDLYFPAITPDKAVHMSYLQPFPKKANEKKFSVMKKINK